MKFHVRAFIDNPGGAYDPAPLNEFDDETEGFIPQVGDVIRWDETGDCYEVVARFFDYYHRRCALKVERTVVDFPYG